MENIQQEKVQTELADAIDNPVVELTQSQYLTFALDGEAFATEISRVREVLEYTQITPVPRTPGYMLGVINLRGNVVPIVDLRLQFSMQAKEPDVDTCIIIVEIDIEGTQTVVGVLADSVQEVIELKPDQLEGVPSLGTPVQCEFIEAMGKLEDRFVIVLDMQRVFAVNQIKQIAAQANNDNETAAA